jgi:hypothetical protein
MAINTVYYIPVNATQFAAGTVCFLSRHVSVHVFHFQVRFLFMHYISCTLLYIKMDWLFIYWLTLLAVQELV